MSRYARLNGTFNAPIMAASAMAPFIGAGLADVLGGYPAAFGVLAGIWALGAVLALACVQPTTMSPAR